MHDREHENGGFTLYKNLLDAKNTYYALKTLLLFNKKASFNIENTIDWIEKLSQGVYGIYGLFYITNILNYLNMEIKISDLNISGLNKKKDFANLKIAYYNVTISKILGLNTSDKTLEWILSCQNDDGGFGTFRSDMESTYYAISSLECIDPSLIKKKNLILEFVNNCKTYNCGFTFIPDTYPPYIEPTYAGVRILEIIDNNPNLYKTMNFVQNLQNKDGGFRRSQYMGISELEYTYKSLYILKKLMEIL